MKEQLEAKKTQLLENKKIVEGQIQEGTRLLEKARADLNAILGAIQVVNQLLEEGDKAKNMKQDNSSELAGVLDKQYYYKEFGST